MGCRIRYLFGQWEKEQLTHLVQVPKKEQYEAGLYRSKKERKETVIHYTVLQYTLYSRHYSTMNSKTSSCVKKMYMIPEQLK